MSRYLTPRTMSNVHFNHQCLKQGHKQPSQLEIQRITTSQL